MATVENTSTALEQAVIARLQARIPELAVDAFPDNPEKYRLNHPIGALLVRYNGSKYGAVMDVDAVLQDRVMAVEVTLVFRSLNGKDGVYAYLEAVRRALTGYRIPAFSKLKPAQDEFVSQGGGEWRYAIDFVTKTAVIEEDTPEATLGAPATSFTIR
jgi:hypothetical protein